MRRINGTRDKNIKDILSLLRFDGPCAKKDLASATGLSFSTVSNLCNDLRDNGVLGDIKQSFDRAGRNPNPVFIEFDRFCTLCIDLELENLMRFAVLNLKNEVLFYREFDISACGSPKEILRFAKEQFEIARSGNRFYSARLIGVGFSVSSICDAISNLLISSAIPMFDGFPLATAASEVFGVPCFADCEANLCAMAKYRLDGGRQNIVYIHILEGVGAGVICSGQLLKGRNGFAAEISHLPLGEPGITCPDCGSECCVEPQLSLRGMLNSFGVSNAGSGSELLRRWDGVSQMILQGDFEAMVRKKGDVLGRLCATVAAIFDPDVVYVGGITSAIYKKLEPWIQSQLQTRCGIQCSRGLKIVCDQESANTIVLGINELIFENWNPL